MDQSRGEAGEVKPTKTKREFMCDVEVAGAVLVEPKALEKMYLDELMNERDAVEGARALFEKRQSQWGQVGLAG